MAKVRNRTNTKESLHPRVCFRVGLPEGARKHNALFTENCGFIDNPITSSNNAKLDAVQILNDVYARKINTAERVALMEFRSCTRQSWKTRHSPSKCGRKKNREKTSTVTNRGRCASRRVRRSSRMPAKPHISARSRKQITSAVT